MAFKVGDRVIYPNQGVGVIEELLMRNIGGLNTEFYRVHLEANDSTVMVPVANADNVGMRFLSDEGQVKQLFDILESDFQEPDPDWKSRYKLNLEKMSSGEVCEVAKVFRNLFYLSFRKSLSFREKRMFDRARSLVVSEIASIKQQPIDATEVEVDKILNESYSRTHPLIEAEAGQVT